MTIFNMILFSLFLIGIIILLVGEVIYKRKYRTIYLIGIFFMLFSLLAYLFIVSDYLIITSIVLSFGLSFLSIVVFYVFLVNQFKEIIPIEKELIVGQQGIIKTVELREGYVTGKLRIETIDSYIQLVYIYDLIGNEELKQGMTCLIDNINEENIVHITILTEI